MLSCILSLRTRDKTTDEASHRLFEVAPNLKSLSPLSQPRIEKLIYPVSFYRNKARGIRKMIRMLKTNFKWKIPNEIEQLLTLPGVGRKTANLVRTVAFGLPGICVDTHVHRISNIWGVVKTKSPDETEFSLRQVLPKRYWLTYNDLLVPYGQYVCTPVSPKCSECPLARICPKIGVGKTR